MQTPYVGQTVWFNSSGMWAGSNPEPMAAIITKVNDNEGSVNLATWNGYGTYTAASSVPYDDSPSSGVQSWRNIVAPV